MAGLEGSLPAFVYLGDVERFDRPTLGWDEVPSERGMEAQPLGPLRTSMGLRAETQSVGDGLPEQKKFHWMAKACLPGNDYVILCAWVSQRRVQTVLELFLAHPLKGPPMTSVAAPSRKKCAAILATLLTATSLVACSSDDKDADSGDGDSNKGGDGDIGAGLSGDGDGITALRPTADGGSVDLSSEQVNQLQSASCTGWAAEGESLPATLELVVDASSSMNSTAPGSQQSKWVVTRDALAAAIDGLPGSVSIGMLHYPNLQTVDGQQCVNADARTPIDTLGAAGSGQRQILQNSLNSATLNTGTPTFEAYNTALNLSLIPYEAVNRFMLLITDGAPTIDAACVFGVGNGTIEDAPTQPIVDAIAKANQDHGIRTFIIGSPGSEQSSGNGGDMRGWLSQAAIVGGTDTPGCSSSGPNFCHMDMTQDADFATSLREGLASVVSQIIDACTFAVPDPPAGKTLDANETNLVVTWGTGQSNLLLPDADGNCDEGWRFNDAGEIELCPDSCSKVKVDNQARVQLTFGCGQEEIDQIVK